MTNSFKHVQHTLRELKTAAIAHIRAFGSTSGPTGNLFDPANVYKHRKDDFVMHFHPSYSMTPPFNGPITRTEHAPTISMLGAVMESAESDIHDVVVDTETRTVSIRHTIKYVFRGVKSDPETRECDIPYVWITEMDEEGSKVVKMEECFLDFTKVQLMLERAAKFTEENVQGTDSTVNI